MQNPLIKKNNKMAYPRNGVGIDNQAVAFSISEYSSG
jgi:hypothetical protein